MLNKKQIADAFDRVRNQTVTEDEPMAAIPLTQRLMEVLQAPNLWQERVEQALIVLNEEGGVPDFAGFIAALRMHIPKHESLASPLYDLTNEVEGVGILCGYLPEPVPEKEMNVFERVRREALTEDEPAAAVSVTKKELEFENKMLRYLLADKRGFGECGIRQHDPIPGCGHAHLQRDCLWCAKEDARRCESAEISAKQERDKALEFMALKTGLSYDDFAEWWATQDENFARWWNEMKDMFGDGD